MDALPSTVTMASESDETMVASARSRECYLTSRIIRLASCPSATIACVIRPSQAKPQLFFCFVFLFCSDVPENFCCKHCFMSLLFPSVHKGVDVFENLRVALR